MRVLLHSKVYLPQIGGIEMVSRSIASRLAKRGIDVVILTDTPQATGPESEPYRVVRGSTALDKLRLVREAQVVHVNGFSVQLLPYCLATGKPLIWTHQGQQASCLHGDGWHEGTPCQHRVKACWKLMRTKHGFRIAAGRLVRWALGRWALRFAAANVAITEWVARNIRAARTTVIWNPAEIDSFVPTRSAEAGVFTFVGRLVTQKGVDVLLQALARCHRRGSQFRLEVYGDGPEREPLARLAAENGLDGYVRFHGMVEGKALVEAMTAAWVVVVPSTYEEPMGIVAAEAMAAGKPLIVSRQGGLAEVAGPCALTFENGDAEELSAQMERVAADRALYDRLAGDTVERSKSFDPERVCDAYVALYGEAIRSRTNGRKARARSWTN